MSSQLVSERDVALTYGPEGWQTVTEYRQAKQLRDTHPDMARAEIARRVGRPQSALRGWLAEGKTPAPVKAIATARDRGWLQLEPESEQFRAFNQLVAWIFSGGGIDEKGFVPTFSVDDALALSTIDRLFAWLGTPYRVREYDEPDRALEVIPDEATSILGRVLTALGAPSGVKVMQSDITLPRYLEDVEDHHRRDFLRVYLFNRGTWDPSSGERGTYIQNPPSESYCHSLTELIESVTAGSATQASQHRIWASADAVTDVAGGRPVRPSLATQIAYGTATPPTERALASTYRATKSPGGMRYLSLYRQVTDPQAADPPSDATDELAPSAVPNWKRGHTPAVYSAITTARNEGWLTPAPDSEATRGLTTLLAWVFARGSLRRNSYHPVFRLGEVRDKSLFDSVAEQLNLSYTIQREEDPSRPTELHITDGGALVGRILFVFGAPCGSKRDQPRVPPVYLFQHDHLARRFVKTWCHHRGVAESGLVLRVPSNLDDWFVRGFATLIESQLSWPTERTDQGLRIPDQTALEQYHTWMNELETLDTPE